MTEVPAGSPTVWHSDVPLSTNLRRARRQLGPIVKGHDRRYQRRPLKHTLSLASECERNSRSFGFARHHRSGVHISARRDETHTLDRWMISAREFSCGNPS
ncbi:hypothetical protein AB1N83_007063 [Pleurotus pulmonarius]